MSDDEWDQPSNGGTTTFNSAPSYGSVQSDPPVGVTFGGRGRGFKPVFENGNRGGRFDGDRGGRGGGRGGRGGRRNDFGRSEDNGNGEDRPRYGQERSFGGGDNNSFGERKFGGGGRGRPRNDGDGNDFENGGEAPKPAARVYIPPEPSEDEDLYGSGINTGLNFKNYDDIPVKVTGEDVPPGIESFKDCGLRQILLDKIARCNYTKPTPVQKRALPIIMRGRDVMACAQTGSGKTAAFLLPIIHTLLAEPDESESGRCAEPAALIVSPTRELATQIWQEALKFTRETYIRPCCVYGGTNVRHQLESVRRGCHILVATPGRLNDFVKRDNIAFSKLRFLVLDEADRMLDMGFQPAIDEIVNHSTMVPKTERQTLMFSATFPDGVQKIARNYLKNYLFIAVGFVGGACSDVEQRFVQMPFDQKLKHVLELVAEDCDSKTVVFVETKRRADFIACSFSEKGIPTTSIHGDREQQQREEALADFRAGRMKVLIATDVASRGLDIKDVRHVINLDMPKGIDEYVHRIGRTGRLGNRGVATSFFDASRDSPLAGALVSILEQAGQEVPDFLRNSCNNLSGDVHDIYSGRQDTRKGFKASQEPEITQTIEQEGWD